MLLRPALFALRAAGHEPLLMAPAAPAAALVGAGPAEVRTLLAWDRADVASLLRQDAAPLSPALESMLRSCAAAVVYSRAPDLAARLGGLIPRVFVHAPQPPPGAGHAASWFASALAPLGVSLPAEPPPPILPTPEESAAAGEATRALPSGFLAVHPGSGSSAKCAPPERFAALAAELSPTRPFALVEGPADREAAARLRALASRAVVLRDLPLRVLGAALARCGRYVGNDSGVSHLAAAYGADCLVLFGPTDPAIWRPVGPRVATGSLHA